MTGDHEKWLGKTVESALEPDLPICDPHHHFWDRPVGAPATSVAHVPLVEGDVISRSIQ